MTKRPSLAPLFQLLAPVLVRMIVMVCVVVVHQNSHHYIHELIAATTETPCDVHQIQSDNGS
jgi:hypothetical protein